MRIREKTRSDCIGVSMSGSERACICDMCVCVYLAKQKKPKAGTELWMAEMWEGFLTSGRPENYLTLPYIRSTYLFGVYFIYILYEAGSARDQFNSILFYYTLFYSIDFGRMERAMTRP